MATLKLNRDDRNEIFEVVKKSTEEAIKTLPPEIKGFGACALSSLLAVGLLQKKGIRGVVQAGSASWRRIKPEDDDGVCATHFSYEWNPYSQLTKNRVRAGILPEMHVWTAIPGQPGEIIDLTTYRLPEVCEAHGARWLADPPAPYIWQLCDRPSTWARYTPCNEAIAVAETMIRQFLDKIGGAKP